MKKTMTLLFLLAVVAGFYALAVNAKGQGNEPTRTPTATAQLSPTPTAQVCTLTTGITSGAVNLRACPGLACGAVLDILTEGESLTIITAGEYIRVRTESGAAGWLNSKYCKGK